MADGLKRRTLFHIVYWIFPTASVTKDLSDKLDFLQIPRPENMNKFNALNNHTHVRIYVYIYSISEHSLAADNKNLYF